jgi:hypothetical protein
MLAIYVRRISGRQNLGAAARLNPPFALIASGTRSSYTFLPKRLDVACPYSASAAARK